MPKAMNSGAFFIQKINIDIHPNNLIITFLRVSVKGEIFLFAFSVDLIHRSFSNATLRSNGLKNFFKNIRNYWANV
jgi:hypothetical protein